MDHKGCVAGRIGLGRGMVRQGLIQKAFRFSCWISPACHFGRPALRHISRLTPREQCPSACGRAARYFKMQALGSHAEAKPAPSEAQVR